MSTKNPRVNVTFEDKTLGLFAMLAEQEHKSISGIVRELAIEALENREDLYLSQLAEKLDQKNTKTINHDQAWD